MSRTRLNLLLTLPLMLFTLLSSAEADDSRGHLTVAGSALVLDTGDGTVLRGAALTGATLFLPVEGRPPAEVIIASVTPDPMQPDLLRHDFRIADGHGGSQPACTPNIDGETWGFPVALPEGHPGREGAITITCASGAVAKCARFGYRPWAKGPRGESLESLHAACVRMVRGDYCGDGQPHTKDGTGIDLYDDAGIQTPGTYDDPAFTFEAGWAPDGAVCVARTRWPDLLDRSTLLAQCPRLSVLPVCTEATARQAGARLFNRTRIKPFTVAPRRP